MIKSPPTRNPSRGSAVRRFFRPDGLLASKHSGFERRPCAKVEMALAVDALLEKRKLIVEAGTGTGKTLAYLVLGAAFPNAAW